MKLAPTRTTVQATGNDAERSNWYSQLETRARRAWDTALGVYWLTLDRIRRHSLRLFSIAAVAIVGLSYYGHLLFYSSFGVSPSEAGVSYDRLLLRSGVAAGFLVLYTASISGAALILHFSIGRLVRNPLLRLPALAPVLIAMSFLVAVLRWPETWLVVFVSVVVVSAMVTMVSVAVAPQTPRMEFVFTPLLAAFIISGITISNLLAQPTAMARRVQSGQELTVSDTLFFDIQGQLVLVQSGEERFNAMLIGQSESNYLLYEVETGTVIRLAKDGTVLRQQAAGLSQ